MAQSIQVIYAAEVPTGGSDVQCIAPTAEALQQAMNDCPHGALLAIGGTAFTPPLPWREWTRKLPRFRPGLGEVVRQALLAQGHPGAALVAVEGAVENGKIVLIAPDDSAVRDAALGVLSELSGASRLSTPALDIAESRPEGDRGANAQAMQEPEAAPPRVSAVDLAATAPSQPEVEARPADGPWRRALVDLGWTMDDKRWADLPDALARFAPVKQVLVAAGERRLATTPRGEDVVICGFPDLHRPESKVLSIAVVPDLDGNDSFEILALHRFPNTAGTCTPGGRGTPASDLLPGPVCVAKTGRAPASGGDLFAVDGRTVYLKRDTRVFAWDGREDRQMGTVSQALASLVLRWSSR